MHFSLSKYFFIWLAVGFIPLSLSWQIPSLRYIAIAYDLILLILVILDWRISFLPENVIIKRDIKGRFAIDDETEISIRVENQTGRNYKLILKDEFPPELKIRGTRVGELKSEAQTISSLVYGLTPTKRGRYEFGRIIVRNLSRLKLGWVQKQLNVQTTIKVYPNIRKAREMELKALGAKSLLAVQRRAILRGEGRDFESLRDYVRGDELRHLSWTATARRGKLVTRQYQIERDQTIFIALDAGRLMTGKIENETKFDSAIQATLALMSAAARGGDNAGLAVFGRRVKKVLLPKRGTEHLESALELLHDIEPEMIEPSYSIAFQFISSNIKRRALIIILTDLVDEEGSKELLSSLKLLRPRHLPLVVTIGDRDLRQAVLNPPDSKTELFKQSVAEEILMNRETALKNVEMQGGLALDVTTKTLAPTLLETYLRVKERGLL